MCAAAEPAAAAPVQAVHAPATARSAAADAVDTERCLQPAMGMQLRRKRSAGGDMCARLQQRQRTCNRSDGGQGAAPSDSSDQQAIPSAEGDSGCRSGGRQNRQKGDSGGSDCAAIGTAADDTAAQPPAKTRAVMAGTGEVLAADMAESTPLLQRQDWGGLRARLQRDGYLLLRGVLPAGDVLKVQQRFSGEVLLGVCQARCISCMQAMQNTIPLRTSIMSLLASAGSRLPAAAAARCKARVLRARHLLPRGVTVCDTACLLQPGRAQWYSEHIEKLHNELRCTTAATAITQARAAEGAGSLGLLARQDLAAAPQVAAVLEAPQLFALTRSLLEV